MCWVYFGDETYHLLCHDMISSCISLKIFIILILKCYFVYCINFPHMWVFQVEFCDFLGFGSQACLLGFLFLPADNGSLGRISDPSVWSPPVLMASTSHWSTSESLSSFCSSLLLCAFWVAVSFFKKNKNLPFLFYDSSWFLADEEHSLVSIMLEDFLKNTFAIVSGDLG